MEDDTGCAMVMCTGCGERRPASTSCEQDFHTLLGWENEFPGYGEVHHLLVLCYHLQHPSLYSPEGLAQAKGLLLDFLEGGKTANEVRRANRERVSSFNRKWKVTARPGSQGAYSRHIDWRMRILELALDDHTRYRENVRRWAASILEDLRAAGEM